MWEVAQVFVGRGSSHSGSGRMIRHDTTQHGRQVAGCRWPGVKGREKGSVTASSVVVGLNGTIGK